MLKGFLLAIAVALLAAGCMGDDGGGGSVSASEGESLVLQQEDVGSEFTQFDSGQQRRADLSPPRDDPGRLDREGGWKARFSRTGSPETQGALVVSSLADLFGSADDAGEDFELYKDSLDQFIAAGGREQSVSGLGDEAYAVTLQPGACAERDPPLRDRLAKRRRDCLGDRERLPPDVAPGACVSACAGKPDPFRRRQVRRP